MQPLIIQPTEQTLKVELTPNGTLSFSGKSLPPDVLTFFQPIIDWVNEYLKHPGNETKVICKLEYLNTASSKLILDVLMRLKKLESEGKKASIEWHYDPDDEDLKDTGVDFSDITGIHFDFFQN